MAQFIFHLSFFIFHFNADDVMMYVPFSGQAITHYNVRKMQRIPPLRPTVAEYAPLYCVRSDSPSLILIFVDRELVLYGRYAESLYFARELTLTCLAPSFLYETDGLWHVDMVESVFRILLAHPTTMTRTDI